MTSRHFAIPVRLSISLISELKLAIWEGGEQGSEMEDPHSLTVNNKTPLDYCKLCTQSSA